MPVIHFLNVGEGDCSIIEHNSGHISVIDVSCAKTPLPLKEQEVVRITIEPELSWAERPAGLLQWKGDPELLQRIAEGDEFSILEST